MHAYSQPNSDITFSYSIDQESKVDFRDSEQLLDTKEEISFEFDLELS
jgi:hypothetical protein